MARKNTEKSEKAKPIKASELIEKIKAGGIEAEVNGDDDCYPQLFSASIEADADGECSVCAYYGYREDSPRYGVSLGTHSFEVEGVCFSASRNSDGGHDPLEISGREIEYDNGLTEADVRKAAEENVEFTEYYPDSYEFDESSVTTEDIVDAVDECPAYFVEDEDGVVRGFDSKDDFPEECTELDRDEAIQRIVEEADVSYDLRG